MPKNDRKQELQQIIDDVPSTVNLTQEDADLLLTKLLSYVSRVGHRNFQAGFLAGKRRPAAPQKGTHGS